MAPHSRLTSGDLADTSAFACWTVADGRFPDPTLVHGL
jgi:hypothetical protein